MPSRQRSFVLEIDEQAVVAFCSTSERAAQAMCRQAWFVDELNCYRIRGRPLIEKRSKVTVRRANPDETLELEIAKTLEISRGEYSGQAFAFLIPIDAWTH